MFGSGRSREFPDMAVITTEQRKRMRSTSFALPKERKYPIPDRRHCIAALARVVQFGSKAEIAKVRRAVYKKCPSLKP